MKLKEYCGDYINCAIESKYNYIVYEYSPDFVSLDKIIDKIKNNKKLLINTINEMDKALGYLHSKGFAHDDFKLENLIGKIDGDNIKLKLIDFGSACSDNCHVSRGETISDINHRLYYLENWGDDGNELINSQNDDLWALGTTVYYLITGKYPYQNFIKDPNYKMVHNFIDNETDLKDFNIDYLLSNKYLPKLKNYEIISVEDYDEFVGINKINGKKVLLKKFKKDFNRIKNSKEIINYCSEYIFCISEIIENDKFFYEVYDLKDFEGYNLYAIDLKFNDETIVQIIDKIVKAFKYFNSIGLINIHFDINNLMFKFDEDGNFIDLKFSVLGLLYKSSYSNNRNLGNIIYRLITDENYNGFNFKKDQNYSKIHEFINKYPILKDIDIDYLLQKKFL
jgi:hypothetical protein